MRIFDPVEEARKYLFVRETTQNNGQRVNAIQTWSGGAAAIGTSWCCWFATMVLDLCYQGESPIPRQGACEDVHQLAIKEGWIVAEPAEGDVFLYVNDAGHAHHIGFVTGTNPLTGISGNTSADGTSSNGDRVAEHEITAAPHHLVFIRIPA